MSATYLDKTDPSVFGGADRRKRQGGHPSSLDAESVESRSFVGIEFTDGDTVDGDLNNEAQQSSTAVWCIIGCIHFEHDIFPVVLTRCRYLEDCGAALFT